MKNQSRGQEVFIIEKYFKPIRSNVNRKSYCLRYLHLQWDSNMIG